VVDAKAGFALREMRDCTASPPVCERHPLSGGVAMAERQARAGRIKQLTALSVAGGRKIDVTGARSRQPFIEDSRCDFSGSGRRHGTTHVPRGFFTLIPLKRLTPSAGSFRSISCIRTKWSLR
jgi:hypothetical protein